MCPWRRADIARYSIRSAAVALCNPSISLYGGRIKNLSVRDVTQVKLIVSVSHIYPLEVRPL